MTTETHPYPTITSRPHWAVVLLGGILILFGVALLAGGIWLITLGGSFYYAPAGLGLILTGALLARSSIAAVWVYFLVWMCTAIWAFWEVGTDWWAQIPRLVAPTVVLILVLLCVPVLQSRQRRHSHR